MRVDDIDPTTGVDAGDDLVTQFNIDLANLSVSTAFIEGDYIGDNGIGLLRLSFRVTCTENFYGSDCATFCVERDDELGHYTCDSEGNIVCREGFQDPSTNCTECILAEGCCKLMYLQQYMLDLHSSSSSISKVYYASVIHATVLHPHSQATPTSSHLIACSMNMEAKSAIKDWICMRWP